MKFVWDVYSWEQIIIFASIILIIFLGALFIYSKAIKRKTPYVMLIFSFLIIATGFIFASDIVAILGIAVFIISTIISCQINIGDLRKFIANPFKSASVKDNTHKTVEKIFDRETMYRTVEKSVLSMSQAHIGAIITFERNTVLKDVIKNGVEINAPVSAELLDTIFYPGTRLHDGAVVIKNNLIVAASVFFTPTTQTFAGKYGSRHRAAIGISEISDSVTIVCSEETGRISLAVNGQLVQCDPNNFLRIFVNYMEGVAQN